MRSAIWTNIYGVVLMLPFLAGMFTKATLGKAILGTVGAAAVGAVQRKQAKKDLAEQRAYDEGAMQRMRDAASKAGFNPLTALRAGALSSFNTPGRILPPGGAAFAAQYLGDAIGEAFDKKANEPIEKYNEELRKVKLEQAKLDLSISRATLGQMAPKPDLYAPYGEFIPVRVGNNTQQLDKTVAQRLGIKPNDRLTIGDIEEIKGDLHGGIAGAVETQIWENVLPSAPLLGTPNAVKPKAPRKPPLSKQQFEQGKAVSRGRNQPRIKTTTLPPAWLQSTYEWLQN